MKRFLALYLVLSLLLLSGCSSVNTDGESSAAETSASQNETSQTNSSGGASSEESPETSTVTDDDPAIKVWYVAGAGATKYQLDAAVSALSEEMTFAIREFASYDEMEAAITTEGLPDLLLLDEAYAAGGIHLRELAADYRIADLTPFIEAEREAGTLADEDYFAGTFYTGEMNGGVFYLPLSLKTYFGVTSAEHYEKSVLGDLPENYTLTELIEAFQTEKQLMGDEYIITFPMWISAPSLEYLGAELLIETGAVTFDPATGEMIIDEAGAAAVRDYMSLLSMDLPQVSQLPRTDAFDALYDLHFMVASNMNLPHQIRYWQSAYSELLDVAMKPIFFPDCTAPGSYGAMASLIGAIGSTSLEKGELAYKLMRTMMDVPASTWTNINIGDAPNLIGPVSKVVFKEELQQLTDNYGANYLLQFSRFKRLALGDEERAVLEDWAEKVQVRPMVDQDILEFASEIAAGG